MDRKILITGDYWHREFKQFLAGCQSVTLMPINKVIATSDQEFDLVVIAQSHPDQIPQQTVEHLQSQFGNTPIVAVLGSWCEGEQRTGQPWPGVLRIYWHQWQGRYESFVDQLETFGVSGWHAPRTSSVADRILHQHEPHVGWSAKIKCVGISASNHSQFEMLEDAIQHFGWTSHWVEQAQDDSEPHVVCNPICIEAASLSIELEQRIKRLRAEFPESKFILLANFPRVNEVERLTSLGVSQFVSRPFELNDLRAAIERSFNGAALTVS